MAFGRIDFLLGLSTILFGLAVAVPTTDLSAGSFTTNNTSESSLLSPGADNEYYAVSGDGQYVEQVKSPNDLASAQASFRSLANASNASITPSEDNRTDSTILSLDYGYRLYHFTGTPIPPPAFGRDMFQCIVNLFELVPPTGLGVRDPIPEGHFLCRDGLSVGELEAHLLDNPVGFVMSYLEMAKVIKLLHFLVTRRPPFLSKSFTFEIRTHSHQAGESALVILGAWRQHEEQPNDIQSGSPQSGSLATTK